jgi:hypothetical protein
LFGVFTLGWDDFKDDHEIVIKNKIINKNNKFYFKKRKKEKKRLGKDSNPNMAGF